MLVHSDLAKHSVDSCSTAIFWIRRDGALWNFNDAAVKRLGYSRDELVTVNFLDIAHSVNKESWRKLWESITAQRSSTFETQLRCKNGSTVVVEISTDLIDFKGDQYLMALAIDISLRKQAEQDLRRSESIQRSIMESSLDSIMLLDSNEKIKFINRTAPGLSIEQVIGTSICDYAAEEFHPAMHDCFQRVLCSGQPDGYQVEYKLGDSVITTWESRVAPVCTDNKVTGLTVISRDVTDRNQAITALRESECSLARAQQIARMGSWDYDLRTGQATASAELYRILGLAENEPIPSLESFITDFIHPDDQDKVARAFEESISTGAVSVQEFRIICQRDQQVCYVRAEAEMVFSQTGMLQKLTGTFHDVSQQKEAELALRESEEKFRVLTERSPAIVFIARSQQIIYCNEKTADVTGYSIAELMTMEFTEIIHPDYLELVRHRHRQRLQGLNPEQRYEIKIITKNGEHRWLDLSAQLIEFDGGPAVLVSCIDNTERKATQAKLSEMNAQLAHVTRLTTMGEMVAGIAHEINQPLSAIANFALACRNSLNDLGCESNSPVANWLEEINDQAVRCGDIIRQLRDFSKKPQVNRSWIDLNQVISDSLALIKSDFRISSIELEYDESHPIPPVHANPIELQQVLVNLLRNACESTCQSGNPEIKLTLKQQGGFACVTVDDNGAGISETDGEYLFDAFFTTKPDGMGMGLAISKSIIESHQGTLRFEPREPHGAKFHLQIPISETESETGDQPRNQQHVG